MRRHLVLSLLFAGLMLPLLPASAHSQLGRLVNKAKEKAEKQAEDATWVPAPAPDFSEDVVEITEASYGRLAAGLRAEVEASKTARKESEALEKKARAEQDVRTAEGKQRQEEAAARDREREVRYAAWLKAQEEHDKKQSAYDDCMGRNEAEIQRLGEEITRLLEQGKTEEAGKLNIRLKGLIDSCGQIPLYSGPPEPRDDPQPSDPSAGGATTVVKTPYQITRDAGEKASGMKPRPYAIMRERWINYCQTDGRPTMGFSEGELEVLGAHKGDCKALMGPLEKANLL